MFRRQIIGVALLSTTTLLFETTLTRLLAVTQFYHFAFLVISLALLGYGASGTLLSVVPKLREVPIDKMLRYLGVGLLLSISVAYSVVNLLPFDSYSIAWDPRQAFLFGLYYLVLTIPFIISGLGIGQALAIWDGRSHLIYAANLFGSGIGALLAPAVLFLAGVPGAVLFCGVLGLTVNLIALKTDSCKNLKQRLSHGLRLCLWLGGIVLFYILTNYNLQSRAPLGLTISPYKGLSQVQRYPDSEIIFSRWNAISRLDVVKNGGIHQLPGLSYLFPGVPPEQLGLSLDADAVQPVTLVQPKNFDVAGYLPESIAFKIIPNANVLVLEPGGGLGILQALSGKAAEVTSVVENELIIQAVRSSSPNGNIYDHQKVQTHTESGRVFLSGEETLFDIIFLPLTDAFRPVSSGAYSLVENYSMTVDSFGQILDRLEPDGLFVFSRWMQIPPSESLRGIAVIVEALDENNDVPVADTLVIFRGIQTVTILVRPSGWTPENLAAIRMFTRNRKFDLVWMPDIQDGETNQFNRLPEPSLYLAVRELLTSPDRNDFYEKYPYNIFPPTDNRPFFFHFFRWEQTPEVFSTLGHAWLPFGGSGYFVLVGLLAFTIILSFILILFPLIWQRKEKLAGPHRRWLILFYFCLLGIAFLFIEIPLIQKFILLLGHPTYAFTIVVAVLLISSGLGSALARKAWLPHRLAFGLLLITAILISFSVSQLTNILLSLPLWGRVVVSAFSLTPLGILMGLPFPLGIALLEGSPKNWIPLAWAVNGCSSVIASVLAALLSLSYGFTFVLLFGAGAYGGAGILYYLMTRDQ